MRHRVGKLSRVFGLISTIAGWLGMIPLLQKVRSRLRPHFEDTGPGLSAFETLKFIQRRRQSLLKKKFCVSAIPMLKF